MQKIYFMEKVSKELLQEIANSLMFEMNESDYQALLNEFGAIIEQMNHLSGVKDADKATPMTFPYEITASYLREDAPTQPLPQEDVLKNVGKVVDGQISIPKVVDK